MLLEVGGLFEGSWTIMALVGAVRWEFPSLTRVDLAVAVQLLHWPSCGDEDGLLKGDVGQSHVFLAVGLTQRGVGVGQHVGLAVGDGAEDFVALGTRVWLLAGVEPAVHPEGGACGELLVAVLAGVLLDGLVDLHVSHQC